MGLKRTLLRPVAYLAGLHAAKQAREFLHAHQDAKGTQDRLLGELIARHATTAFGRDHGFDKIRTYEDFIAAVPIGSYETLRPYMNRVLQGETTALLPPGEAVMMFATTSGTTGEPKHIPVTREFLADVRRGWNIWGSFTFRDHDEAWLRSIVQISSPMNESVSPTGLPCGAISGLLAATQKKIVRHVYAVPACVTSIADPLAKYYAILRCGLAHDVAFITTANPSSTIKLFETGQAHAEQFIRDVADGEVRPPTGLDAGVRQQLRFRPNRALARRMEAGIRADGTLLPRHFWNLAFLANWTGGTLKLYLRRLKELAGDIPVRDIGLLASEGRFCIPIGDGTAAGLAEITGNFMEFLPVEDARSAVPRVLRAHEVEVGAEYFLVITNRAGLWRYNMDDRVRIVDRYGTGPVFEFLCRGLHTANITGEKLTEHQVVEALRRAVAMVGGNLSAERFVLQGHFAALPYYLLSASPSIGLDVDKLAETLDRCLCELNIEYAGKRTSGRLGPIRATTTLAGAMEQAEEERIRLRHGRREQYKHQYLLTDIISDEA